MIIKKVSILSIVLLSLVIINCVKMNEIKNNKNQNITIAFTGDVMLGRLVNDYVILGDKPSTYVWGDMLDLLKKADLRIINLENAIASTGREWSKTPKVFFYRADPKAIDVLKAANIDYVTLANNHVLDYEEEAFIETLKHLEKNNIPYAGAGRNLSEASKPAFLTTKGIKIAVIAFTDNMPEWEATKTKPGVNYIEVFIDGKNFGMSANRSRMRGSQDSLANSPISEHAQKSLIFDRLEKIIKEAKNKSDIVIVSAHWGPNMRQRPTKAFKEFAHAIIDAGADIFHGHSAHIFQGIEIYKGKLIMYDTGDFVDDYAFDEELRNDQTFLFLVTLNKERIEKIELVPGLISLMQVSQTKGIDFEEITNKMIKLSEEMGTKMVKKSDRLEVVLE